MEKKKVIMDVDTGSDDAIAIMMAVLSGQLDILGITVTQGNRPLANCVEDVYKRQIQGQSILGALHTGRQGSSVFLLGLSLLFTVLGNFLPKCSHNYFVGIRTPWTLASPDCWRRTHRVAGVLWVVCGLAGALAVLSLPRRTASFFCAALFAAAALIPVGYSLLFYRGQARRG